LIPASAITGIDHTLVGVRDLEAARAAWDKIGFRLTPRGRHIGWGTGNYCIMLEQGYIELLGILDPTQFTNNLDKFVTGNNHGKSGYCSVNKCFPAQTGFRRAIMFASIITHFITLKNIG